MPDRLFFALTAAAAVAMIALALAWPVGRADPQASEAVSEAVSAAVSGDVL